MKKRVILSTVIGAAAFAGWYIYKLVKIWREYKAAPEDDLDDYPFVDEDDSPSHESATEDMDTEATDGSGEDDPVEDAEPAPEPEETSD